MDDCCGDEGGQDEAVVVIDAVCSADQHAAPPRAVVAPRTAELLRRVGSHIASLGAVSDKYTTSRLIMAPRVMDWVRDEPGWRSALYAPVYDLCCVGCNPPKTPISSYPLSLEILRSAGRVFTGRLISV